MEKHITVPMKREEREKLKSEITFILQEQSILPGMQPIKE